MKRVFVAGLALAAMAACTSPGPGRATQRELDSIANQYARAETRERQDQARQAQVAAPPTDGDTCGAGAYADRVGTPVADMDVPAGARVIRPDSIVTQDFRQDRLNIDVNAEGTITGFRCF